MIFHITHTHTSENCSAHRPERQKTLAQVMAGADEQDVKILSMYSNPPAHRAYLVVEAETTEALNAWFDPLLEFGTCRVEPVVDALADLERRLAEA